MAQAACRFLFAFKGGHHCDYIQQLQNDILNT